MSRLIIITLILASITFPIKAFAIDHAPHPVKVTRQVVPTEDNTFPATEPVQNSAPAPKSCPIPEPNPTPAPAQKTVSVPETAPVQETVPICESPES